MVSNRILSWTVWGLAAFFYLYEFLLRVSPEVMVPDLMRAFSIGAEKVGVVSAFYFYLYAPMQLPVGLLVDRYGARRLLTLAAFSCGIGGLLFGLAPLIWVAEVGRLFIGFGSSFGWVCLLYVSSHWFAPTLLALLIGLGNSMGMIGAIGGASVLTYFVQDYGWRNTSIGFGGIGILFSILVFFTLRGHRISPQVDPNAIRTLSITQEIVRNLKVVSKNLQSWINAGIALLFYPTTAAFGGLWSVPFFTAVYKMTPARAGWATSCIFFGWLVGGPIIGILSDRMHRRKVYLILASLICCGLISLVIYFPEMPNIVALILLFIIGLISAVQLLNFSISIEINPRFAKATASAFTNFFVVIGTTLFQLLIGFILSRHWEGVIIDGVRIYSDRAYQIALACLPISFFLAFLLSLGLHDSQKHPKGVIFP